jgi:PKD repeat protein
MKVKSLLLFFLLFGSMVSAQVPVYVMNFDTIPDFALTFLPWGVRDLDSSATYGINQHTFTNNEAPMAYICFNPAQVVPSMADDAAIQPHSGTRFGACFAAVTPPNNDWLITPRVQLEMNGLYSLWVKSYTDQYGLEKFRVLVSTTNNNPASFTAISDTLTAPLDWTQMTFNLSAYNNMQVYIALQCVSSNSFIFMVDDIEVYAARDLVADFTASNTAPAQGANVNFTDQSTGSPTAWSWSFPGGTPATSTQQNPAGIKYLLPGSFDVTLVVTKGTEKDSLTKTGYINVPQNYPSEAYLDFEDMTSFSLDFTPWNAIDLSGGYTYGIGGTTFPNSEQPMAWICFEPGATSPPLTNMIPYAGKKLGCSFSSVPPHNPDNKWLITPQMVLGDNPQLTFYVSTYNGTYGLEKFKVGVSTGGTSQWDFNIISGDNPQEAPLSWTKFTYNLVDYKYVPVFIGIQNLTNDGFIMMIDNISVSSILGVPGQGPAESVQLYPNPARDRVTLNFGAVSPKEVSIGISDALGKSVRAYNSIRPGSNSVEVDVSGLNAGIYYMRIVFDHQTIIKKIAIAD